MTDDDTSLTGPVESVPSALTQANVELFSSDAVGSSLCSLTHPTGPCEVNSLLARGKSRAEGIDLSSRTNVRDLRKISALRSKQGFLAEPVLRLI